MFMFDQSKIITPEHVHDAREFQRLGKEEAAGNLTERGKGKRKLLRLQVKLDKAGIIKRVTKDMKRKAALETYNALPWIDQQRMKWKLRRHNARIRIVGRWAKIRLWIHVTFGA